MANASSSIALVVTSLAVTACVQFGVAEDDHRLDESGNPAPVPAPPPPRTDAVEVPAQPECVAPANAAILDLDATSDREETWARPPGEKLVVYFQSENLPAAYAASVERGAELWSASPCIDARFVAQCPAGSNCVTVRVRPHSFDDPTEDGETDAEGKPRVRAMLTLYTDLLDSGSDRYRTATTVHGMGHTLGLRHRESPSDVMNVDTTNVDPEPDAVDFVNLRVLYGMTRTPPAK